MVLGKKNSLLLTVALSLIFCFSIPCSAENDLAVTFGDNSGIWLYNALSGDWQGTWTSQAGYYTSLNGSGGLWAHFDVAPSGDFTGGVYLTNTTSGSIYQDITGENNSDLVGFGNNQDLAFDMDFRRGVISGNTITGDFEVQSRMYPVYHGSYTLNRRTWGSQITPSTPENIVSSDDRIFADFGTGGLWMRNGTVWTMLTRSNPKNMVTHNFSGLFADFELGGIWWWTPDTNSWTMLTPSNPEDMVTDGNRLYADFGAGGIWMYSRSTWTQLTPSNPEKMVSAYLAFLYADFGAGGLWKLDGISFGSPIWKMLTPSNPEDMVATRNHLFADFGAGGIWVWNNTNSTWTQISDANPENMAVVDSDRPTLYADFGSGGIYMWNGSSWRMIANANPEKMVVSGSLLYADFGSGGIYMWDGALWNMLSTSNPSVMAAND